MGNCRGARSRGLGRHPVNRKSHIAPRKGDNKKARRNVGPFQYEEECCYFIASTAALIRRQASLSLSSEVA